MLSFFEWVKQAIASFEARIADLEAKFLPEIEGVASNFEGRLSAIEALLSSPAMLPPGVPVAPPAPIANADGATVALDASSSIKGA